MSHCKYRSSTLLNHQRRWFLLNIFNWNFSHSTQFIAPHFINLFFVSKCSFMTESNDGDFLWCERTRNECRHLITFMLINCNEPRMNEWSHVIKLYCCAINNTKKSQFNSSRTIRYHAIVAQAAGNWIRLWVKRNQLHSMIRWSTEVPANEKRCSHLIFFFGSVTTAKKKLNERKKNSPH